MMSNTSYLTISIDDGHPKDFKSAELLARYGLKATFYIPARNPEREVMSEDQVREIAANFEVGSHTFNHKRLIHITQQEAHAEIENGKKWLEDVTGKQAVAFCYPQGKFNPVTVKLVEQAGFRGARTCMLNLSGYPKNRFLWGVSTHAYSHTIPIQIRHGLLERNFRGVSNFAFVHRFERDWAKHFLGAVDYVQQQGGIAHLYFHSWEIDQQGEWSKLESLLKNISQRKELVRVTNGELFAWRFGYSDLVVSERT